MHKVRCPKCGHTHNFDPITTDLTDKQRATLEYIKMYISENGQSPTHREIATHFGVDRKTMAHSSKQGRLDYLRRKGYITWSRKRRSIKVIEPTYAQASASVEDVQRTIEEEGYIPF